MWWGSALSVNWSINMLQNNFINITNNCILDSETTKNVVKVFQFNIFCNKNIVHTYCATRKCHCTQELWHFSMSIPGHAILCSNDNNSGPIRWCQVSLMQTWCQWTQIILIWVDKPVPKQEISLEISRAVHQNLFQNLFTADILIRLSLINST